MFSISRVEWAIGACGVGVVSLLLGLLWQNHARSKGTSLDAGLRLGSGPHVSVDCPANGTFADKLAKIVRELREAAIQNEWGVDWEQVDSHCDEAVRATSASDHRTSIKAYGRAIHLMIAELQRMQIQ